MRSADKNLRKEQARYKRNFDSRLSRPKYDIPVGSYVFLLKEQGTASEPKHKLAQVATGPYAVKNLDQDTVVIPIGDQEEQVSRDRVELAPSRMDLAPATGLRQALQLLDRTDVPEERDVIEDGDDPHAHAPLPEDPEELVNEYRQRVLRKTHASRRIFRGGKKFAPCAKKGMKTQIT